MMLSTQKANAYSFLAINNEGDTIYYNITSSRDPLTVEVTYNDEDEGIEYTGNINIPSTVTYLNNTYTVTAIGESAFFMYNNLTSVTIPNTVTVIEIYAFSSCIGLTSVTIGNSVTTIGNYAFAMCSTLVSLTIPNSVTTIGDGAFAMCMGLTSLTIPNSVTMIGDYAFTMCMELTSLTISNAVTIIGDNAFSICMNLMEIYVKATNPPRIYGNTFSAVPTSIPVYVCGSVEDYRKAAYWSEFTDIRQDNNCNVGIANASLDKEISIYPNPATDNINIILPENISQAVFTLYDMQGKVLIRQEVNTQEAISISDLASGIYIYNVRTNKQSYQGKLIRK
jgi:hypothetical protein